MTRHRPVIAVDDRDRQRINALAARLTADGPGFFGQAETIRHLLNCYEDMTRDDTSQPEEAPAR